MTDASEALATADIEVKLLLEAIYLRFHYDFRSYSMASLRRRIAAAMVRLECATVTALQEKLLHQPETFTELLQYLTVQVSDLFRDPSYFKTFRDRIVPELRTYPSLKVWIAGCATGEEVYSFAVVLKEEGLLDRALIYATDISPTALAKAEAGIYAADRLALFEESYARAGGKASLGVHLTAAYGGLVFDKALRNNIVFSDHSLATDNVFAEVHVVSCRNVLIYFDSTLQERAIGLFADAIGRRGFLGLGGKETLQFSAHHPSFQIFSREDRWYQRC